MAATEMKNLTAGRELDALVAEKVMGWRWLHLPHLSVPIMHSSEQIAEMRPEAVKKYTVAGQGKSAPARLPHYSTNMGDAWLVVEGLRANGWWFSLTQHNTDIWDAKFWQGEPEGWFPRAEAYGVSHENSAPFAICRAALAAVEASA